MKKIFLVFALCLVGISLHAQTTRNGSETFVPGAYIAVQIPNAGSTGTTLNKIAKLTGTGTAVIATTSDTTGLLGVVSGGAGTTGNASIATAGQVGCVFDGATTANDYVIESVTTNGDCHDGGSTPPTVQTLGRVLSTNGGAGTYKIAVAANGGNGGNLQGTITSLSQGQYICANSTPALVNCTAGAGINTQSGTSYAIQGGAGGSSDRGKVIVQTNVSAMADTIAQAGTAGFEAGYYTAIRNLGVGAITLTPTTSTINGNSTLVLLEGQQANIISDGSNYVALISGYASATSGSISGAIVGIGCDTGTVTINGAAVGMVVSVTPTTFPGNGLTWQGYVSSANTITVDVCSDVTVTPTASVYNISVFPKIN